MKALTSKSRQNFITISTIVGLLIIFSFYFFIYVPGQEKKMQKENFRVLTRITTNIKGRIEEYREYINERARIAASFKTYFYQQEPGAASIFENDFTRITNYYLRDIPELELIYFSPVVNNPDQNLVQEKLGQLSKPYFIFIRDTCSYEGEKYEYGFTLNAECFQYLVNDKAFEESFLRRNEIILSGPESGVLAGEEDSLLKSTNGLRTGRFFSQEISGSTKMIFAQPFLLGTDDHFVLCGFIDQDEYHRKTRNLSGTTILIVLLLLFILALSLPFVKFLLMSRNERLSISDSLLAGITVILGTSVVVLILLDVYTYYIPVKETREKQMADLSFQISGNFQKEINAACGQLKFYDSLVSDTKAPKGFMNNYVSIRDSAQVSVMDKEELSQKQAVNTEQLTETGFKLIRPKIYSNFNQVFWTDSAGLQLFKWSTGAVRTPMITLGERTYFQKIIQGKVWTLPGKAAHEFYLEGIYSRTTAENLVAIGLKSNYTVADSIKSSADKKNKPHTGIVAMITELNSVMDPILPMGNGFCIIDNTGKVIFHSDRTKNLSENFIEECSARDDLKSAMYSRTPNYFSTAYQGAEYKMYVRPLNSMPFYLVTFQDNSYSVTSNTEVLSLSVLFVVFFFLFICVQVIVLRIITKNESQLKAKIFSFDWLWPLKGKQKAYQQILIFLIPSFFLLLFFLHHAGPVETLLIFFVSSIFTFALLYLKIDQFKSNGERKSTKEFLSSVNKQIISASFVMLIILNIISYYIIDDLVRFCAFQVILSGFAITVLVLDLPILKRYSFRKSYLVIMLGVLMLVSIIPTFAFFRISFEKEAEISVRHTQLELASDLNKKSDELNKTYHINDRSQKDIYCDSFYKTIFLRKDFPELKQYANPFSNEDAVFSKISISLTPSYNDIVTKENNLADSALDGVWSWEKYGKESMLLHYNDLQKSASSNVDSLIIRSQIPAYTLPVPFGVHGFGVRGSLFWIGILFSIIGLYGFIRFFVRIIFTTDFFRNNHYNKLGIISLKGFFDSTNVFLVGPPYSGKTNWLKKQFDTTKIKYEIDLNSLKSADDVKEQLEKCKYADIIVIDHFEYGFRDYAAAERRLRLFEGLKQYDEKRVLVVSNVHPRMFLSEYPKPPVKSEEETKTNPADLVKDDCDRWTKILGGYHKIYFPASGIVEQKQEVAKDLIDCECNGSYFLRAQKAAIREYLNNEGINNPLTEEEIILRIESLAHVYYNSIWASLSEEEQYILYDIAQDGLVNLKNREVLTMLLNKGLLIYENRFRMMNESFRNFVLSEVSADDALELERKVKETGSWNYFKTPVIIILITIALFIFITQEETYNNIIAFITTFAAGIPILFRLLGMITSMKAAKAG